MRRASTALLVCLLCLCGASAQDLPSVGADVAPELAAAAEAYEIAAPTYRHRYTVRYRSNYDGDTLRVDFELGLGVAMNNQVLRLGGLDAPEASGATKAAGIIARDFVHDRLTSADEIMVILEEGTKGEDKHDKYGRWIGTVAYRVGSGWYALNDELIVRGLAIAREYK
jgi:endonuclease YncB( thermonuclease family)